MVNKSSVLDVLCVFSVMCVPGVSLAGSLNAPDSAATLLEANPLEIPAFLEYVKADPDVSVEDKAALEKMLNSNQADGDFALSELSSKAYCDFFNSCDDDDDTSQVLKIVVDQDGAFLNVSSADDDGKEKLYPAARVGTGAASAENLQDCMQRRLCVVVSKADQRLFAWIKQKGGLFGAEKMVPLKGVFNIPVSTGARGKETPSGYFDVEEVAGPNRVASKKTKYPGASLGYFMQIHGNFALHMTNAIRKLGRAVSHGCIRMTKEQSGILNYAMREVGGWVKTSRVSGRLVDNSEVRVLVTAQASVDMLGDNLRKKSSGPKDKSRDRLRGGGGDR